MNHNFEMIASIIRDRRTVKAASMNGKIIPDATISKLLALADCAPTHARTEPWRFNVYRGEALTSFCKDHAQMYWDNTAEEVRKQATFDSLSQVADNASHLVVVMMKRTPAAKIPWNEEFAATAAAVQNILLGAEALQLAAIWNTGGMALKQPMKDYLQLEADDCVMGFIYLGYTDQPKREMVRNIPLAAKINWVS